MEYLAITGTVAAGLSAVAALGSWKAAHRANRTSAQAQATGERAFQTADAVARIEKERWHADLLPQFNIAIEGRFEGDRATLSVRLVGPLPLHHLDEVQMKVVASDDMSRTVTLAGSPSQDDVDAQVWGPLRFVPGVNDADANGRTVPSFPLQVGAGRPFALERTRPPLWQEGNDRQERWRNQWLNKPMRLILTCRREGFDPWVIPYEVEVPGSARLRNT